MGTEKLRELGFREERSDGETRYTNEDLGVHIRVTAQGITMESDHGIPGEVIQAAAEIMDEETDL